MPDGTTKQLILIEPGRESSTFVDPTDATQTPIEWEGRWRTLEQAWTFAPLIDNFTTAWNQLNFPRLLRNTFGIAILSARSARWPRRSSSPTGSRASGSRARTRCSSS